jgi:hypothetical protein
VKGGDPVHTPHGDAIVDACGTVKVWDIDRELPIGWVDVTYLAGGRRRYRGTEIAKLEPVRLPVGGPERPSQGSGAQLGEDGAAGPQTPLQAHPGPS